MNETQDSFSSDNIKNFKRNLQLKEDLNSMDFNHIKKIVRRIKEIDKRSKDENNNNNINNFNSFNDQSQLEQIATELRENLFNVRGIRKEMYNRINREKELEGIQLSTASIRFDLDIKVEDEDVEYTVVIKRIKIESLENLDKFTKNSIIYITNLRAVLDCDNHRGVNLKFMNRNNSKIYTAALNQINNKGPNPNQSLSKIMEIEKLRLSSKTHSEMKSETIININQTQPIPTRISVDSPKNFSFSELDLKNQSLLDLTKDNESTFIDILSSTTFDELLIKIPDRFKDFSHLLEKEVETTIYGMTNISSITTKKAQEVEICGFIESYERKKKCEIIKLVSLSNSNSIRIFNNKMQYFNLDIKENMVVLFKHTPCKVNKDLDITLDCPYEHNIKIVGLLRNEDATRLRKFRFNKDEESDCIIDLVKNKIVRRIKKYSVVIKRIYEVRSLYDPYCKEITGYPKLKILMKCLVDDGTSEAKAYLENYAVINLLNIDRNQLNEIDNLTKLSTFNEVNLYDYGNFHKILNKANMSDIKVARLIIYATPFSIQSSKNFFENNYNKFFETIDKIKNKQIKAKNLTFINGDIVYERDFLCDMIVRPYLKVHQLIFLE